jgi:hypothetical protein
MAERWEMLAKICTQFACPFGAKATARWNYKDRRRLLQPLTSLFRIEFLCSNRRIIQTFTLCGKLKLYSKDNLSWY